MVVITFMVFITFMGDTDVVWRETQKFKMLYLKDGECYRAKDLQQDIYSGV